MGDIFGDNKEEHNDKTDSNIEWKKSGIDKQERVTLKIDVREANLYNAKKRNDTKKKKKPLTPKEVPHGFKKISKKIRDSLDDDEDENDYILVPVFMEIEESSLIKALSEDEKQMLSQRQTLSNVRMQETAGKEAAIHHAEHIMKQAGLKSLDERAVAQQKQKLNIKTDSREVIEESLKRKDPRKEKVEKFETRLPKAKFEKDLSKIGKIDNKEVSKIVKDTEEKENKQLKTDLKTAQQNKAKEENKRQEENKRDDFSQIKQEEKKRQDDRQKEEQKVKESPTKEDPNKEREQSAKQDKERENQNVDKLAREKAMRDLILEKSGRANHDAAQQGDKPREKSRDEVEKQRQIEEHSRIQQSRGR